jgi:hypothetical protein
MWGCHPKNLPVQQTVDQLGFVTLFWIENVVGGRSNRAKFT